MSEKSLDSIVEGYSALALCPACRTSTNGRGCVCSREEVFADADAEVAEWFAALPKTVKGANRGKRSVAETAMIAALSRQARRAGYGSRPSDHPDFASRRGSAHSATTATEIKLERHQELELPKPKWHPPRTKFTKRALTEPD